MSHVTFSPFFFFETNARALKVAETVEDACKLLETGFEYVTDMERKKLFRKRK